MKTRVPKKSVSAYGAEDARAHLPELLERAHHGSPTIITKRGRPYAALVSIEAVSRPPHLLLSSLKGSGAGLWGEDAARTVAILRDEWE